jgi:NADPH:quinone reductase-like Zn-dependent oxidoreductase
MEQQMAQHRGRPTSLTRSHQTIQQLSWQPSSPPGPGEILVRVQACGVYDVDEALSTPAMSQPAAHDAPWIRGRGAAGSVIAAGERVTRFAVGDEVFGHFLADAWAWDPPPCARTTADGPHVELRPEGLDPVAAAALAEGGLIARTILRAVEPRPGETALVIGATSTAGTVLVALFAQAGARVIAGATPDDDAYVRSLGAADTVEYTTRYPIADALASHPDVDLLVDLVNFSEPYFITAGAFGGRIVTALPGAGEPGIPRIGICAEPGDLAALAQRALDGSGPVEITHRLPAREGRRASRANGRPAQPAIALGG